MVKHDFYQTQWTNQAKNIIDFKSVNELWKVKIPLE